MKVNIWFSQNILNKWRDGDDAEMQKIAGEEEEYIREMFQTTVNEEKMWADYLFQNGSMIGLNERCYITMLNGLQTVE